MYNVDFLPQLEESARHLFGNSMQPPSAIDAARYVPPRHLEAVPCHQDTNGEWVPDQDIFTDEK